MPPPPETPRRLKRERRPGWRKPPNSFCINRPGMFGNPFTLEDALEAGRADPQAWVAGAYRGWLNGTAHQTLFQEQRARVLASLGRLRGRHLLCYCSVSEPCHADHLLALANFPAHPPSTPPPSL